MSHFLQKQIRLNSNCRTILKIVGLFLVFTFFSSSIYAQHKLSSPSRQESFEIILNEEWQFYYNAFLSAEEMQKQHPIVVHLPHLWSEKNPSHSPYNAHGFGTYYKQVILSEPTENLGIYVPTTSTNYALYINEILIGQKGKPANSPEQSEGAYDTEIYQLPFNADTLDIIFHISNYDYRQGGMWKAPVFGSIMSLEKSKTHRLYLQYFLLGAIMMLCLYHLGVNFPHFNNRESFYFALLCLTAILRIGTTDDYLINEFLPEIPWELIVKIEFISFYMMVGFTGLFILDVFRDLNLPQKPFKGVFITFLSLSITTAFSTVNFASYLIPIAEVLTILALIVGYYFLIIPILKGDREPLIFLFGATCVVLSLINFALGFTSVQIINIIISLGIFIFFFCCSVVIARRYGGAFVKLAITKDELKKLNTNLEEEIRLRTLELHNNNEELNKKNKALKVANQELESLMQENDGLISMVAHDLKSPLARNLSLIELVQLEGPVNENQKQSLQIMLKNNKNGIDLIRDLLQMYSMQASYQYKMEWFNVQQVGKEFLSGFKETVDKKQLEIVADFPAEEVTFYSDLKLINRILENLFSNAVKFSQKGKKIMLSMKVEAKNLIIICKDEGPGISKAEQALLFKRFQRLSNPPTAGESSTGLGLSIVKQIVDSLKGDIKVESELKQGTTFTITLPLLD